jgi:hypothetical protein
MPTHGWRRTGNLQHASEEHAPRGFSVCTAWRRNRRTQMFSANPLLSGQVSGDVNLTVRVRNSERRTFHGDGYQYQCRRLTQGAARQQEFDWCTFSALVPPSRIVFERIQSFISANPVSRGAFIYGRSVKSQSVSERFVFPIGQNSMTRNPRAVSESEIGEMRICWRPCQRTRRTPLRHRCVYKA